jgi:hypothetical protein
VDVCIRTISGPTIVLTLRAMSGLYPVSRVKRTWGKWVQSPITTDVHGDAVINLGHNDSVTLAGVSDTQLQHSIQAGHFILH